MTSRLDESTRCDHGTESCTVQPGIRKFWYKWPTYKYTYSKYSPSHPRPIQGPPRLVRRKLVWGTRYEGYKIAVCIGENGKWRVGNYIGDIILNEMEKCRKTNTIGIKDTHVYGSATQRWNTRNIKRTRAAHSLYLHGSSLKFKHSVPMVKLSLWIPYCHHGYCIYAVTMDIAFMLLPWILHLCCYHGYCMVTPWILHQFCHHGYCIYAVTMNTASMLLPWILYGVTMNTASMLSPRIMYLCCHHGYCIFAVTKDTASMVSPWILHP